MRIAINMIGFVPGSGGVETYLKGLIGALQKVDDGNEYLLLCDEPAAREFTPLGDRFKAIIFRHHRNSFRSLTRVVLQRTLGYDILRHALSRLPIDVIHHPLTILNPSGLPYPAVLTFHDMQQEVFPEFFSIRELELRRTHYASSVAESREVITVSQHAKTCLVEHYGTDPRKIHVIHSGCGEDCHLRDTETLSGVLMKYSLFRPFIIYPAATWQHKNHGRLVEALHQLVSTREFDGELILTGSPKGAHGELISLISTLGMAGRVRWLGYVPRHDLVCLYNLARLMVFPSLYEGFGLPVVEAMASGCPVACSNTTSLPEVAGDAAIFFDPGSVEEMAAAIRCLWINDSLHDQYSRRALERSCLFRWEEAALQTVRVYHRGALV